MRKRRSDATDKLDDDSEASKYKWKSEMLWRLALLPLEREFEPPCRVVMARCLFCIAVGREEKAVTPGRADRNKQPRAPVSQSYDVWYPFRPYNIRSHHRTCHKTSWQAYTDDMSDMLKSGAPPEGDAWVMTVKSVLTEAQVVRLHKRFDTPRAKEIWPRGEQAYCISLGGEAEMETLLHDIITPKPSARDGLVDDDEYDMSTDDEEYNPPEGAPAGSSANSSSSGTSADLPAPLPIVCKDGPGDSNAIIIRSPRRFEFVRRMLKRGQSFRNIVGNCRDTHELVRGGYVVSGMTLSDVQWYSRMVVGISLLMLSQLMKMACCYSVSIDTASDVWGGQFLSVIVRLAVMGLPGPFEGHVCCGRITGTKEAPEIVQHMFRVLESLDPQVRQKLLAFATDGENAMTGWRGGAATLVQSTTNPDNPPLRVWCMAHQLQLALKHALDAITDSKGVNAVLTFVRNTSSGLRHNGAAIDLLSSNPPTFIETR
eukprot:GHVU01208964.1.p1 GENE.GHVU01208964.1~~GHVU01208964.1.p1  ORF type:complete len:485 (+),score=61.15 GHVU01208964.1:342-1796(+)